MLGVRIQVQEEEEEDKWCLWSIIYQYENGLTASCYKITTPPMCHRSTYFAHSSTRDIKSKTRQDVKRM